MSSKSGAEQPGRAHDPESYVLSIDLGTTRLKAALCSLSGELEGHVFTEIPIEHPESLRAEIDANRWWTGVTQLVPKLLQETGVDPDRIEAASLCGLMHALVPMSRSGEVLARSQLWMDQRCSAECDFLRENHGERIRELTGGLPLTTTSAAKLFWLKRHRGNLVDATHQFLLPKDFLRFKMTGEYATDPTDAGGTALLRAGGGASWSEEYLDEILEVPPEKLPRIQPSARVAGQLTEEAAAALGLRAGMPVVTGGSDVYATMLGTNMFTAGRLVIYMGTAAWVARGFETDDPQAPTIGATSSCGSALKWYLNKLCQEETSAFEELEAQACDLPVGSDGMVFLPHLMGERSPYRKPAAKGVFFGLTLSHDRAHMYRAILEGTSCHLRHILEDCGGADAREIWCVGGCAGIELWMRVLSSVTGKPVITPRSTEAALMGGAMLAAVGSGRFPDVESAASAWVQPGPTFEPQQRAEYESVYERYRQLDEAMQPFF